MRDRYSGSDMEEAVVKETQDSIAKWADETFGRVTTDARIAARINEEMAELLRAVTADMGPEKIAEECADVVIVLYRLITRQGGDLFEEIDKKMATNRARVWKKDGTGHGYHVSEQE